MRSYVVWKPSQGWRFYAPAQHLLNPRSTQHPQHSLLLRLLWFLLLLLLFLPFLLLPRINNINCKLPTDTSTCLRMPSTRWAKTSSSKRKRQPKSAWRTSALATPLWPLEGRAKSATSKPRGGASLLKAVLRLPLLPLLCCQ